MTKCFSGSKSNKEIKPSQLKFLQSGESARAVEVVLHEGKVVMVVEPLPRSVHLVDVGEPKHGSPERGKNRVTRKLPFVGPGQGI